MGNPIATARRHQVVPAAAAKPPDALGDARALPKPRGTPALAINARLLGDLAKGDGDAALATLLRCAWEVEPVEQMLAAWLPCLVALEALERARAQPAQASQLREFIVNSLRAQLSRPVTGGEPLWIVASTPDDAHLAWVLATVLSQRARPARPWLWDHLPIDRPFLSVGRRFNTRAHNRPECRGHYALVARQGDLGITGLFQGGARDPETVRRLRQRATTWRRDLPGA